MKDARRPSGWERYPAEYRRKRAELLGSHPYCSQCGSTANLEVDHIRKRGDGGGHNVENLRAPTLVVGANLTLSLRRPVRSRQRILDQEPVETAVDGA
ncbi:MAG TPA: HNH endonuclease signature motif containing protein [Gaiellaceae bacterium]|nr:HNH endonuclease signature motif containing protein [Gaiellaceae bacterium]